MLVVAAALDIVVAVGIAIDLKQGQLPLLLLVPESFSFFSLAYFFQAEGASVFVEVAAY